MARRAMVGLIGQVRQLTSSTCDRRVCGVSQPWRVYWQTGGGVILAACRQSLRGAICVLGWIRLGATAITIVYLDTIGGVTRCLVTLQCSLALRGDWSGRLSMGERLEWRGG